MGAGRQIRQTLANVMTNFAPARANFGHIRPKLARVAQKCRTPDTSTNPDVGLFGEPLTKMPASRGPPPDFARSRFQIHRFSALAVVSTVFKRSTTQPAHRRLHRTRVARPWTGAARNERITTDGILPRRSMRPASSLAWERAAAHGGPYTLAWRRGRSNISIAPRSRWDLETRATRERDHFTTRPRTSRPLAGKRLWGSRFGPRTLAAGRERGGTERSGAEQSRTTHNRLEQNRAYLIRTEQSGTKQNEAEQNRTEHNIIEQSRVELSRTEHIGTEQNKAE